MADGTRLKEIQEAQKKTDILFMDERARRQASEDEIHGRLDQQYNRNKSILGEGLTTSVEKGSSSKAVSITPTDKITAILPGKDTTTTKTLEPTVLSTKWSFLILMDELVINVLGRFEDLDSERVMTDFNKLHHETTVSAYLERFEELKDQMLIFNKNLEEEFFMLKFINGLKLEVKSFVSTCNPTSLNQVVILARKQEHTVSAILRKALQPSKNTQTKPLINHITETPS
ncbi:UNVERIFIED_CONTAM: hypothetical protein Slati_2203000 [Sesamum latifolium]|uniref:Retrotransposon gag domain-containing protein n=1 Tax=Sesamum latifolium TaxID=2727402 RepID=A0AAW2WTS7_9LAMI